MRDFESGGKTEDGPLALLGGSTYRPFPGAGGYLFFS